MATEKKVNNKIHIGSRVFDVFLVIFMILFCVIMLYPFLNVIAISMSSNKMVSSGQVTWFPREFNVLGYELLFKEAGIWRSYFNTIVVALGSTICTLTLTSMMAYVMMVPDFVFRKAFSLYLLITMFFSGGVVPGYLLINNLHLMNNWLALILPGSVSAYNVFVYRSFFKGISIDIRDAARIDGAGELSILLRIYVPLSKALYATFGLFAMVGVWNSYFNVMLYIRKESLQTIQMVLRRIVYSNAMNDMDSINNMVNQGTLNPRNVQYACIVAVMLPIMLIYPFLQKYFVKGVQVGSVKG